MKKKLLQFPLISEKFTEEVKKHKSEKTKAAATEHAIRNYIEINIDEDPELFASFSKALEEILKNFMGNWKKIYEELEKLRQRISDREKENTYGLDRKRQMPFFRVFKSELYNDNDLTEDEVSKSVALTINIVEKLQTELRLLGFWSNTPAQNHLKGELQKILLSPDFCSMPGIVTKRQEIITRIMEVAKTKHSTIISEI